MTDLFGLLDSRAPRREEYAECLRWFTRTVSVVGLAFASLMRLRFLHKMDDGLNQVLADILNLRGGEPGNQL